MKRPRGNGCTFNYRLLTASACIRGPFAFSFPGTVQDLMVHTVRRLHIRYHEHKKKPENLQSNYEHSSITAPLALRITMHKQPVHRRVAERQTTIHTCTHNYGQIGERGYLYTKMKKKVYVLY